MNYKKVTKLTIASTLTLGIFYSPLAASASDQEPLTENIQHEEVILNGQLIEKSQLTSEQLEEYNSLETQGYEVSAMINEEGYVSINGYKVADSLPVNSLQTSNAKNQLITPFAVDATKQYTISQKVYLGYMLAGTIKGNITVKYNRNVTSVTPISHSLDLYLASGKRAYYTSGNPGKVQFNFVKDMGNSMSSSGPVPFETYFYFYTNGKMSFSNPQSTY